MYTIYEAIDRVYFADGVAILYIVKTAILRYDQFDMLISQMSQTKN